MVSDVSIIVPVHNGEKHIKECIDSLLSIDYPKEHLEIIVVDNNSTDNTASIVKKYPVIYLFEKKIGSYNARNNGIKNSRGDIVAFTDVDCVVHKNWIKYLVKIFEKDEKIGGVGGNIVSMGSENLVSRYTDEKKFFSQESNTSGNRPFIITANAAYRRNVLIQAGLFDEKFYSSADVDISWRIKNLGYKIKYEPKAIVYHKHRETLRGLFKQFFKYGSALAPLYEKHNLPYYVDVWGIARIFYNLVISFPWRIITLYRPAKTERKLYLITPIFDAIRLSGENLGQLYSMIRVRLRKHN